VLNADTIEGFVGSVLISRFDNPAPIPDFHREMWRLCTSRHPFVAIAAPRGFAKSTAITHSYVLSTLLFRERRFVLLISGTEAQAILFLNDLKNELKDNEKIHMLFGKPNFLKDAETDIIVELQDGHRFRVMAKGAEQQLRGAKWAAKRPDLIICDDIEEDECVINKDRREKFRKWFFGALLPLRSDTGIVRVVGTILHMDSMLERLMPEFQLAERKKLTQLVVEPLRTSTQYRLPWLSVKYRAHDDNWSHLLWPEKRTREWLESEREKYRAQGLPEIYSQEYLNIPIDESTAYFKRGDFTPRLEDDRKKGLRYYIGVDLAISEKDRADYTAFCVGGMDENGILHIINVVRERMNALEIVDTFFALESLYHPEAFAVEDGQISKAIGPFLYEEMVKRQLFPTIVGMTPSQDKMQRARSMQARMRARGVRFDKEADWYQNFQDELVRFPRDKHDDQVDSFAYLGLILNKMVEAPTKVELEDEQYADELSRSGYGDTGRNAYTGY
jgi:predicted phage terminase large subunit-like protein